MRYRLEQLHDDKLVIRNVETDLILGSAAPVWVNDPRDPNRCTISAYTFLNRNGVHLATVGPPSVQRPLEKAAGWRSGSGWNLVGVVSVFNLELPGVGAPERRPTP